MFSISASIKFELYFDISLVRPGRPVGSEKVSPVGSGKGLVCSVLQRKEVGRPLTDLACLTDLKRLNIYTVSF